MTGARSRRGGLARVSGRRGEVLAALLLMFKGYRVLGFRLASPQGEIDLLAIKGGVLAVVEVKRRTTIETALEAVRPQQRERVSLIDAFDVRVPRKGNADGLAFCSIDRRLRFKKTGSAHQ